MLEHHPARRIGGAVVHHQDLVVLVGQPLLRQASQGVREHRGAVVGADDRRDPRRGRVRPGRHQAHTRPGSASRPAGGLRGSRVNDDSSAPLDGHQRAQVISAEPTPIGAVLGA